MVSSVAVCLPRQLSLGQPSAMVPCRMATVCHSSGDSSFHPPKNYKQETNLSDALLYHPDTSALPAKQHDYTRNQAFASRKMSNAIRCPSSRASIVMFTVLQSAVYSVHAFTDGSHPYPIPGHAISTLSTSSLQLSLNPSEASLIAGGIGGMMGVAASYPLDTLKTRAQLSHHSSEYEVLSDSSLTIEYKPKTDPLSIARDVYESEGIIGFYSGVETTMIGQAVIKSLAFASNAFALEMIQGQLFVEDVTSPSLVVLMLAAAFAGFVVSFVVVPIGMSIIILQTSVIDIIFASLSL